MPTWSRDGAMMTMSSPLGPDGLIPISLTAREQISQPFELEVVAASQTGDIDADQLLNNPACVILMDRGSQVRSFHGIVQSISMESSARSQDDSASYQLYRLRLVPRLWFLNQTSDCRIFEEKSAGQILQQLLADAGITDISGPPSSNARQSTVQYNETDLRFATRLMEEEGWFYFFTHSENSHTLNIANANSSFSDIPNASLFVTGGADEVLRLTAFNACAATVRGKMTLDDYEPVSPTTRLQNAQPTVLATGGASTRDEYRWPAAVTYLNQSGTDPSANASDNVQSQSGMTADRAKWSMEAAEARAVLYSGSCTFGGLVPGGKFTVASQPSSPQDGSYVVKSVVHYVTDDTWLNRGGRPSYANQFVAFPSATTWREPIVTLRPEMSGIYSGLVMGPQAMAGTSIEVQSGEEIYTDDLARVKVRLRWDWREEGTGSGAVWARVVQPWAGKGWGMQFLPRVGTEVAVAFADGDPDRPVVIGGLYNGAHAPIYLTAEKNKSGLRTRSTLSGGTSQFSELTFDDTANSELVFLHAEKDMFTEIENDQTLTVGHDRVVTIKNNETVDIRNNQTITVKQNRDIAVTEGNSTFTVSKGTHTSTIQGDTKHEIKQGSHLLQIDQGNRTVNVGQGNNSLTVTTGNNSLTVSQGNHTETVSVGNYSIKVSAGQMSVDAMQGIQLTSGPCSIKISPSGITISGLQISLSSDAQGSFDGGGLLALKGGLVQINS